MRLHPNTTFFLLGLIIVLGSPTNAATLSGSVLEKGSKAPVIGASLYLEPVITLTPISTKPTAVTTETLSPSATSAVMPSPTATPTALSFSVDADMKGKYQVSVPEGNYRLTVAGEGFGKLTLPSIVVHENTNQDFFLVREGFTLPEVVVSTSKDAKTSVSHEVISKNELKSVPGTGGDVLRALQSLPGVAVAGDYSGQLIVRGGGPEDNLYLLDRIPLAFPFHFGGLISTVNSDLIKNVDFSAGGFGPQGAVDRFISCSKGSV